MMGQFFRAHGKFCASHPWEVIVTVVTLTLCMTCKSGDQSPPAAVRQAQRQCHGWDWRDTCEDQEMAEYNAADVILMTIVRCSAVLYCYYQFRNLHKLGSKYILGIAVLFALVSSLIFMATVFYFLGSSVADLKDAMFFFLLLVDLSKVGILAQLALNCSNQAEVTKVIARGMEILGPSISLDTLVEALVIRVGTLSGVHRLELLCGFAVMSVIVNYVLFMTLYPACLSLILELSRNGIEVARSVKGKNSLLTRALYDEDQKPNPVVQRVKIIMSTGLIIVHAHSRFTFSDRESESETVTLSNAPQTVSLNRTEPTDFTGYIMKWIALSAEQIIFMVVIIALTFKLILFEDRADLADQLNLGESHDSNNTHSNGGVEIKVTSNGDAIDCAKETKRKPLFTLDDDTTYLDQTTQTENKWLRVAEELEDVEKEEESPPPRPVRECVEILNSQDRGASLSDEEIRLIVKAGGGHCPLYNIESVLNDPERGVKIRRQVMATEARIPMDVFQNLPYRGYDYSKVMNACCENVLGYVQIPVGYAGPLLLDGTRYFVPMATTEGALVASTNRGCKALLSRGVTSVVQDIGMTRAPCVRFPDVYRASQAKRWIETQENYVRIKDAFDSTSRYARLQEILIGVDGRTLYIRFRSHTGDAMGMNMVSKGAEMALRCIQEIFPEMEIISLSGNFCSDKKPAAVNWIKGRGKHVVCESIIPADKLKMILKTDAKTLVQCNKLKNLVGSAMAGSIGGNNAHAANMVTAIFLATGQDPAQNVTSSNCSTSMEVCGESGEDLYVTCTMPSLEVGTIGGGTVLPAQSACLEMLGVRGAHATHPAENAKQLARIICATVMAGEISLMSALVNSDLVKSHMRHNRSYINVNSGMPQSRVNSATGDSLLRVYSPKNQ
ncbi:3-hydroxy-3-methylglutaryl-coenzyme A reductase [Phlebotomus argentipes]|uniref:3-hydroxy-3-methylglutaryl-coenzyme A reductase n=1 Tax=Phlebotomus argentipes TaxID=94469 RepID=UPI0028936581|nr:3-hydroxy-3-methylglutaryl-coenzyme A reductase [Phlebotomus argentipes]